MNSYSKEREVIESSFERRQELEINNISIDLSRALERVLLGLEQGKLRIVGKEDNKWVVQEWIKKAILLVFRSRVTKLIDGGYVKFFDKLGLKYSNFTQEEFIEHNVRIVPPAYIRQGVYIGNNVVVMPSYINIGAYIDDYAMIDIGAVVASGAQIGKHTHISAGVIIGGVLEPLQDKPTIVEDHCFIGANAQILEGVLVEEGSVIAAGVTLTQSIKIYDVATKTVSYGCIPAGSVVVSGMINNDAEYSTLSAIIIKKVDANIRAKTSINELLRA